MPTEIERRFTVRGLDWKPLVSNTLHLEQGYFSQAQDFCLRVRIVNREKAFLTVKGNRKHLLKRPEFEYDIPLSHAEDMLRTFCGDRIIRKQRNIIWFQGLRWEVDEFQGRHAPLVLAEVELTSTTQNVPLPPWIGREITDDIRFSNQYLAQYPRPELPCD